MMSERRAYWPDRRGDDAIMDYAWLRDCVATVLSVIWSPTRAQQGGRGGDVMPCSLAGVNPADHPDIFGDPEGARNQYGFVHGPDGKWTVMPNFNIKN
jgi:hypothetical protein